MIASTEKYYGALLHLVATLKKEAEKPTIAPENAFVLVEWFSVLLEQLSEDSRKRECYLDVVRADASALDTCLASNAKGTVKRGALVVTRRGLRKLFRSETYGLDSVKEMITALASKGHSTASNASMLGVIAGVASRLPAVKTVVEEEKKLYYSFYVRDILGSRITLSEHIADGLHDFWASFATLEDIQSEVIPALEKALLRAPEIILNNLVAPMVLSLDSSIDLSQVLQAHLLKPLLANTKSSSASIRDGALRTFTAVASKCCEDTQVEKAATELITPLKQGKITSADQRTLHAQMLRILHGTKSLAEKVVSDLGPVAFKEANENALSAEVNAIATHVEFGIRAGDKPKNQTTDLFVKGLSEKRTNVRRLWSLRVGEILWNLSLNGPFPQVALGFCSAILGPLLNSLKEVEGNPVPAIQNGLIAPAFVVTALSLETLRGVDDQSIQAIIQKSSIVDRTLTLDPKPSFLLNPRVYSKLTTDDDFIWCTRAIAATARDLPIHNQASSISIAWAEAILFMIAAASSPLAARREAVRLLSNMALRESAKVTNAVVAGLWRWVRSVEFEEKDSPAMAAKTGCDRLHNVVGAICPTPQQRAATMEGQNNSRLVQLLVLSRPELIPRVTWIDLCLKVGIDPGKLVHDHADQCLEEIIKYTEVHGAVYPIP